MCWAGTLTVGLGKDSNIYINGTSTSYSQVQIGSDLQLFYNADLVAIFQGSSNMNVIGTMQAIEEAELLTLTESPTLIIST